jgi:ABC-type multidrug transport system ATPase subunit
VIRAVRLLQEEGKTIVITSHDVDVLAETASRIAVMAEGRIVHEGDVRTVLGDQTILGRYGFPLPGAVRVFRMLNREGRSNVPQPVRLEELRDLLRRRGPARGGEPASRQ